MLRGFIGNTQGVYGDIEGLGFRIYTPPDCHVIPNEAPMQTSVPRKWATCGSFFLWGGWGAGLHRLVLSVCRVLGLYGIRL